MKSVAIIVAAFAAIGAAAVAATSIASVSPDQVRLAAVGAPLPQDPPPPPPPPPAPGPAVPTPDQMSGILVNLADAGASYKTKDGLVEGGIASGQGHTLDHELRKAYRNGELPLTFNVTNVKPAGPNAASADVAISGPKIPAPVTKNLTFVNQGGWKLSHDSAQVLAQSALGQQH